MLYYILTVDGDWPGYFRTSLGPQKRKPVKSHIKKCIENELNFARKHLNGRLLHFVHTSPVARDFFTQKTFISLWRRLLANGGSVGVHCHEDLPYKAYYYRDTKRMSEVMSRQAGRLRKNNIEVNSYRGGFLTFAPNLIPILEKNRLFFDFSCEPGRHLIHNKVLVSDWRGAPRNFYRLSRKDHRRPGRSKIYEIPVGSNRTGSLYPERNSVKKMAAIASGLSKQAKRHDVIVSVLSHTYEFVKPGGPKKTIEALKKYGQFINVKQASRIIRGRSLSKN